MNDTNLPLADVNATEQHEVEPLSEEELSTEALENVSGGVRRRGPGTQTEDDVYVG